MRCFFLFNRCLVARCQSLKVYNLWGAALAFLVLLPGCKDARVDGLEQQVQALQQQLAQQEQAISDLQRAHSETTGLLEHLALGENLKFRVQDTRFDVVVKAFEPLVTGTATLNILGDNIPDLIFVEWSLQVVLDDKALEPISYIQRVEKGKTILRFAQGLPRHNLKPEDIELKLKPTGWYLAHIAHSESEE